MNIPNHWKLVKLGDVLDMQKGKTPFRFRSEASEGFLPYLNIEVMEGKKIRQYADTNSSLIATEENILLVGDGSRSGLAFRGKDGVVASTLHLITTFGLTPAYLYYYLQYQYEYINQNNTGSSIPHLNQKLFNDLEIPLTSIQEQERIIKKLDAELNKIAQIIDANRKHIQEIPNIKAALLDEALSSGEEQEEFKIGDITDFIGSGTTPNGGQAAYTTSGVHFIRSQNVLTNKLDVSNVVYIDNVTHQSMARTQLQNGDVLLNITGASIGRSAVVPPQFGEGNVNQHVCILRVKNDIVLPEYLCLFLNSSKAHLLIQSFQGGAGRESINISQIKSISLNIPKKLEEQQKVIDLAQKRLNGIDKLEGGYKDIITQNEKLRQSFLEQAFEGKFSSLDPNDEPVEALQERVGLERNTFLEKRASQKKNDKSKTQKSITLKQLSDMIKDSLYELFREKEYQPSDLTEIYRQLTDEGMSMEGEKSRLNFEDFANAFDILVRNPLSKEKEVAVNMYLVDNKIVYQNNLSL